MKITNNLKNNVTIISSIRTVKEVEKGDRLIQKAFVSRTPFVIPAGSILEIVDATYLKHEAGFKAALKAGDLTIIKAPVLSPEAQAKADDILEKELREQMAQIKARKAAATEAAK